MDKHELDAQNSQVIKEFRARDGKVGGMFEGMPLLLLHHVGAKTGAQRTNPMTYQRLDDTSFAVFGSNDAAPAHPNWYHNLRTHPRVIIEVGSQTIDVLARVAEGAERERIWSRQKELNPLFAEFERRTTREIPVVVLDAF
ncbi:nitroreductase family deazaflavin-dependent oxidoreductase [Actinomadura graeca]|uniref:nitroreductase family deazaflavin-dependent oxidoreductase n=1 Tax=Actinomadura graeca TaxID=2750812 RepID=UPI001E5F77A0|nr:nitroreductase family deazaflavin-dependent oxidoreductase [Actinomadura graeca]